MNIIKKILEAFVMLLVLFVCGIGFFLLIRRLIEEPTYVPCYVGVIFLASITAFILFSIYILLNLPIPSGKPKPKTFSKYLVIWLVVVIYVCALGASLLWWGYTVAEHLHGLLMAFAIILTVLGIIGLCGLFWQITIHIKNKFALKHGVEAEATFIDSNPAFSFHTGKDIGGTTIFQYWVKFKYIDGEKEIIVKSHSIYSEAEVKYFEQAGKFLVKYNGKTAVISQLPEEMNNDN